MTANPSALSYYGIAKETTKGTFAAAVDYLPLTKFDPDDKTTWLKDDGVRGSMAKEYDAIQGPYWSEIAMSGPVFPDSIPYALCGILGDVTESGSSAPYTHTAALKNSTDGQPTSYSLNDYQVVENRGFAACQFYTLDLKFDGEKLLTWDGAVKGFRSAVQTKPTLSYSTVTAVPGWLCTPTINSVSQLTVMDGELKLAREGGPIHTADGTQNPYQMFVGTLKATGKLTVVADANTHMNTYLAGSKIPIVLNFTSGSGPTLTQVQVTMTKALLTSAKVNRGKAWVEYVLEYEAFPNTTDVGAGGGLSPVKAVIQNAKAASIYV